MDTRAIALNVINAKGLDAGDRHLRKAPPPGPPPPATLAIRAGYSPKTVEVQGCRLLSNAKVAAAVAEAQAERAKRTQITADMVVQELAKLGFSNMLDYIRPSADGDPS